MGVGILVSKIEVIVEVAAKPTRTLEAPAVVVPEVAPSPVSTPEMPDSDGPEPPDQETPLQSNRARNTGFLGKTPTIVKSPPTARGKIISRQDRNEVPASLKFLTHLHINLFMTRCMAMII